MPHFKFVNTWRQNESAIRNNIRDLWLANFPGMPQASVKDRLDQVVFAIINEEGKAVGASTSYRAYISQLQHHFYAFRCFIDPSCRVPGLTSTLLVKTRDFLESFNAGSPEEEKCLGLITLVENERIKTHRNEAVWPASQMIYIGNSPKGNHIRVYYFKKAMLTVREIPATG